ncbi:MAG: bifunctional homocysteine S-methyltransferase/methylenetetrahydrofolate reductase [Vicinamibacterales bacterium]
MNAFLDDIDSRVLVCDGAMGTMLYARGVFINRCFDALNITEPNRVAEVHQAYARAGADVLETNTFGANRLKLRAFGLGDRVHDINREGARIARSVAGDRQYVAGAIGPLGVRIEPWGKLGVEEAESYFREQAQALVEGGVDLFILETFRDVTELGAAIAAVRRVSALPVVAQLTIEEDGCSLDGTPPEQFVPQLEALGADVIGVNCSIGPAPMYETVERMAGITRARLSAQPNAGRPRDIEGRNIYLSSPEYMASYARRFVARGVRLVGGCCGTTPEHIRQIAAAVHAAAPAEARGRAAAPAAASAPGAPAARPAPAVPTEEKSDLARAFAEKRFVTMVELRPPKGHSADALVRRAARLAARGLSAVSIPDGPRGARMSGLSVAVLTARDAGIEPVLQYSCRDRNLLGMQSDLLGAHALGVRNLVVVTGDVRGVGDYPDATAVFDVDSIGLANVVARLNHGLDIGGQEIGTPTAFLIGVMVNPGAEDIEAELRRFEYKLDAGAEFVVTKPVFDVATFERLAKRLEASGVPVVAGLWPFESALNAEFMANEVPGVRVPDEVVARMRAAEAAGRARAEGVAIAAEVGRALRARVAGMLVATPSGEADDALAVLDGIG